MEPSFKSFVHSSANHTALPVLRDGSQESSGTSESFCTGDAVKLLVHGVGEVGDAVIVDARPSGEWLGVVIPMESWVFILLRPMSVAATARTLDVDPSQRDLQSLGDVVGRSVLWRVACVRKSSGQPSTTASPFSPQNKWVGLKVHLKNELGELLLSGRINCCMATDHFQQGTLGDGEIGVTLLDVFRGNRDTIMTHCKWPLSSCWFPSGHSLTETLEHFAAIPAVEDPLAYLGGRLKAPYRFIVRKANLGNKDSQYVCKTQEDQVRKVSSLKCCDSRCCQFFPQELTLQVRQKFYLKSFEDRCEYGISTGGQILIKGQIRNRKFITLVGTKMCTTAWHLIHGIPKSTYHSYIEQYKAGVLCGTHGNKGIKRPRLATVQVSGTMKAIIDNNADQMPHQMRSIGNGRMDTLKFLPAGNNWKRVRADANELNVDYGFRPVSQSTISRLKKELFNNVSIKPVGSTFAKCSTCDQLQQFILKSLKGSPEYVEFVRQRTEHLNHQASCRRLYKSWREESKRNPREFLCVIHDKMDTAKTALPRMRVTTKATQGLGQLPMSVTGMVAHGHCDGAYAHYALSCWPGDSNFTVSSLARLFRRLEGPPIHESGELFPFQPANPMFEAILRGKSRCSQSVNLTDPAAHLGAKPLPKCLYLQLDNSAKDNKNQYLMAFLSLLTARRVFQEIQVGFLLVGHTHEDIDAYFSHLSKALKNQNTFVVADLMKAFMTSQDLSFMPEFIQEVGDFKSFVKDYQSDGSSRLIGLGEMHLFRFYVDGDGVPIMRYKKSAVDSHWLPSDQPATQLWKRDVNNRPMLPPGEPKPVPFNPVWGSKIPKNTGNQDKARELARKATVNKEFMLVGIQKYIEYWKSGMNRCAAYAEQFGPYVDYWNRVLYKLQNPMNDTPTELVEGFWPKHNWRLAPENAFCQGEQRNPVDAFPEDEELEPYCGPANEASQERFNPWRDVRSGSWVLLRPEDPSVCPVWLGRALSADQLVPAEVNHGKFLIQYWQPDNSKTDLHLKYLDCWNGKWVVENTAPTWVDATCVVYSTWSKVLDPRTKTIPKRCRDAALQNLNRANEVDP